MGNEWVQTTIGDFLEQHGGEIKTGPFGTKLKASEYSEVGVPVISVGEVQLGRLTLHERTPKVDVDVIARMPEYLLKTGDIVFGRKGAVERSARVRNEEDGWFLGSDGIRLRLPECCDSRFIAYSFLTEAHKQWMVQHAAGTTMASLNEKIIRLIPLSLPPLPVQKAIADHLEIIDNKIALNRQINTTLESMAQALFKSWFVDFDPVIDNALAAGNEIPDALQKRAARREALRQQTNTTTAATDAANSDQALPETVLSDQHLPPEIQQLFPDRFVLTEEMGWVPEGWEVASISTLANLNPEAWSNKNSPDYVKYVDLANAKNGRIDEVITYSFSESPSRARRVLRIGDTIFGTVRPGNRSFALIHEEGLTGSTGFAVLRPKTSDVTAFIYFAVTRQEVIDLFAHLADGAAYPAIRPDVVADHVVVIPPAKLLEVFESRVMPMLLSIGSRELMNSGLSDLRDSLLPKLLSGQITIPDAEQQLAEVL